MQRAIKNEFNVIKEDIINIATTLEENAASFQEISARTEVQMDTTIEVSNEMMDILTISGELEQLSKI